jgi:tetratricopeptide (TPR) repeat protein
MLDTRQKSMLAGALDEYREAQLINADRAEGHLNLGWLHTVRGELAEAEAAFEKAREIEPYFVPAFVNLADVYRQQGRDDEGPSVSSLSAKDGRRRRLRRSGARRSSNPRSHGTLLSMVWPSTTSAKRMRPSKC